MDAIIICTFRFLPAIFMMDDWSRHRNISLSHTDKQTWSFTLLYRSLLQGWDVLINNTWGCGTCCSFPPICTQTHKPADMQCNTTNWLLWFPLIIFSPVCCSCPTFNHPQLQTQHQPFFYWFLLSHHWQNACDVRNILPVASLFVWATSIHSCMLWAW